MPEKGLLKPPVEVDAPPDPKLKLKLPPLLLSCDPDGVLDAVAPNKGAGAGAGAEFDGLPNKFDEAELEPAVPKLNTGGGAVVSVPRPNCFLAGDAASCFIGLPPNKLEAIAGGDFGAPNRDLAAA